MSIAVQIGKSHICYSKFVGDEASLGVFAFFETLSLVSYRGQPRFPTILVNVVLQEQRLLSASVMLLNGSAE